MKNVQHSRVNQSIISLKNYQKVLKCSLSLSLMQYPVVINICGHTFEKSFIVQALKRKPECPLCKRLARVQNLCINFTVQDLLLAHKTSIKQKKDRNTIKHIFSLNILNKKKVVYKSVVEILKQYIGVIVIHGIQIRTVKKQPKFRIFLKRNMSEKQINMLAKQTFAVFNIQVDQKDIDFTIKQSQNRIQFIKSNYLISWDYDDSFYFGQYNYDYKNITQRNGQALNISIDKHIYIGQYFNNKWHGKGIVKYNTGDIYDGQHFNNTKSGKGKYYFANDKSTYQGDFMDNKKHGKGKYCFNDKQSYQGDWNDGNKHGKGIYCYPNKQIYQGDWKDDRKHGNGKYRDSNGFQFTCNHINGVLQTSQSQKPFRKSYDRHSQTLSSSRRSSLSKFASVNNEFINKFSLLERTRY